MHFQHFLLIFEISRIHNISDNFTTVLIFSEGSLESTLIRGSTVSRRVFIGKYPGKKILPKKIKNPRLYLGSSSCAGNRTNARVNDFPQTCRKSGTTRVNDFHLKLGRIPG